LAVVQDPESAAYPDMPRSALAAVEAAHIVALPEMGSLLCRLVAEQVPTPPAVPEDIQLEARLTEKAMHSDEDWQKMPGRANEFTCPECGGSLKEVEEAPVRRFRCHVGHSYVEQSLLEEKDRAVEDAFWIALRTLQEQAFMLNTLAREEQERGRSRSATSYAERARESERHASRLQDFLAKIM
jgi:two-component system, chemotaxis family, protein-glutamate methylesterase/glutaminase